MRMALHGFQEKTADKAFMQQNTLFPVLWPSRARKQERDCLHSKISEIS